MTPNAPQLLCLIFATVLSAALAAPPVGIFPIVECPDDLFPQVVVTPSLGNIELAANQYVVCFKGIPYIYNCSKGLFFNWSTMSCDIPYEKSVVPGAAGSNKDDDPTSALGDLDLIPAGPIQVPTSPQFPVPIWTRRDVGQNYPFPPYPVTKPNPSIIMPIPVLPAYQPPLVPRPVPYYYY